MKVLGRLRSVVVGVLCIFLFLQDSAILCADDVFEVEQIAVPTEPEQVVSPSAYVSSEALVDPAFGDIQCLVDAQIYEGMKDACSKTAMISVYGNQSSELFQYACEVVNPCFAFATSKGEAGGKTSEPGVSMLTVIATNNRYYTEDIDWVFITSQLEQVNVMWYLTHCDTNKQTNVTYNSCYMPMSYLQNGGSDGLGVGPYQITTSDWDKYSLEERMSPTEGWLASMRKAGTHWFNANITPISDITVFALLSMSHQGGSIIESSAGVNIANAINTENVQSCIRKYAWEMYQELLQDAQSGRLVGADNMNVSKYVTKVYEECGIDFTQWTYSGFSTNTGNYVMTHTLQYVFYKYYFGLEEYVE